MSAIKRALVVGALLATSAAYAEPTVTIIESSTAEKLTRIGEQSALLSAEKAKLDLEFQVMSKRNEINALRGRESGASSDITDSSLPSVTRVEGIDGKLSATLNYGNGLEQVVREGNKIRGGWTATRITLTTVEITKGKQQTSLAFGTAPDPYGASARNQAMPMQAMPMQPMQPVGR